MIYVFLLKWNWNRTFNFCLECIKLFWPGGFIRYNTGSNLTPPAQGVGRTQRKPLILAANAASDRAR